MPVPEYQRLLGWSALRAMTRSSLSSPYLKYLSGVHVEVGVAVGAEGGLLPVEIHLRVVVDALELEEDALPLPFTGNVKPLCVLVIAADVPADIAFAGAPGASRLIDHGVVRNSDRPDRSLSGEAPDHPVLVERCFFHNAPSGAYAPAGMDKRCVALHYLERRATTYNLYASLTIPVKLAIRYRSQAMPATIMNVIQPRRSSMVYRPEI